MSKISLKKELATMTRDQMSQIILDAYSANQDIKEYFDFFLNPDIEKLLEKHDKLIMRELGKTKWGYSKARTTIIKKAVKKFISFNPGPEPVIDMLFLTLNRLGLTERYLTFKEPMMNYVAALSNQIIRYADENEMTRQVIERMRTEIENPTYTSYFKNYVSKGLNSE